MRKTFVLCLLLWAATCVAETISVDPSNPNSHDSVTVFIAGTLPPSDPFADALLFSFAVTANKIRVDICVADSIIVVPPEYRISVTVGRLLPATYVVESYHAFCAIANGVPIQLTTPQLVAMTTLAVSPAPQAIPALGTRELALLIIAVFLVVVYRHLQHVA